MHWLVGLPTCRYASARTPQCARTRRWTWTQLRPRRQTLYATTRIDLSKHPVRPDAVCSLSHLLSVDYKVSGYKYKLIKDGRLVPPGDLPELISMLCYGKHEIQHPVNNPLLAVAFSPNEHAHTNVTRLIEQLQGPCSDFEETKDITLDQVRIVAGLEPGNEGQWSFFCIGGIHSVPMCNSATTTLGTVYTGIAQTVAKSQKPQLKKTE